MSCESTTMGEKLVGTTVLGSWKVWGRRHSKRVDTYTSGHRSGPICIPWQVLWRWGGSVGGEILKVLVFSFWKYVLHQCTTPNLQSRKKQKMSLFKVSKIHLNNIKCDLLNTNNYKMSKIVPCPAKKKIIKKSNKTPKAKRCQNCVYFCVHSLSSNYFKVCPLSGRHTSPTRVCTNHLKLNDEDMFAFCTGSTLYGRENS